MVKINPMRIRFCLINIALAGLFFLGFIAHAANAEELSLEQKALSANVTLQNMLGEKWITLPDFAFLLKGSLKEDPVSRRSEITFKNHRLVFLPESKKALYDEQTTEMKQSARLVSGTMIIPFSFAALVSNLAFVPAPRTVPVFQPVPTEKPVPEIRTPEETPLPQTTVPDAPTVAEIIIAPPVDKNQEFVLVIDAGHGDQDSGAVGPWGLREKDVNLDLVLGVADYLKKNRPKVKVVLTRKDDTFLQLEERTQLANSLNADMFVSIHTNSAKLNRYTASGVETFYPRSKPTLYASANNSGDEIASLLKQGGNQDVLQRSQYLAALIQEDLIDIFIKDIVPDRGIKGKSFFVLKYTNMVAVLVEVGFICNPNIEANLKSPAVRRAIAAAIGKGIESYLDGRALKSSVSVDQGVVEEQAYD
ncbi:MAG: N-acetylmuramoyl-L-alanine amidase [Candidatus Omnitrophica bacterium]|nr:N-acetylmuramoyl-L-alanine amidase [Candidatus Omnitrophota bacterium]